MVNRLAIVAILAILVVFGLFVTGNVPLDIPPGSYICDQNDVDLVIVTDTSKSMQENCYCADGTPSNNGHCTTTQGYPYHPDFPCNIIGAKDATKSLIAGLQQNPNNKIALVEYGSKVKSFEEFEYPFLESSVDEYESLGLTCISCGIRQAVEEINKGWMCIEDGWCNNDDKIIVLMSDGEANRCYAGVACTVPTAHQQAIDAATDAYVNHGIRIYTIAYGDLAKHSTLRDIASVAHGQMFVAGYDNIDEVYLEIGGIVTCQKCDEDGVCESGENCQRCPLDCVVGSGQVCCNGEIRTIECSSSIECTDNDICTDDVCDTGSCTGTCTYDMKPGYKRDSFGNCQPPCQDGTVWGSCSMDSLGYYCQ